jgi:hypothetical protein
MKRILLIALATLSLAACGTAQSTAPLKPGSDEPQPCASGGGSATIDWVDFFQLDGVSYSSDNAYSYKLTKADLGPIYAETRCRLSDIVTDPEYQSRDGDAGFMDPGTPIYELPGYDPSFRLAAKSFGEWRIYESYSSPDATHGRDLLDLEGKVDYIGINSVKDGRTEISSIRDSEEVKRLVEMVLAAPIDELREPKDYDNQMFVAFHLDDGSATSRAFYPSDALLWQGMTVPEDFVRAIEEARDRG